jgi:hypothetical protein
MVYRLPGGDVAQRLIWIACAPLALLGWAALVLFTGQVPPSRSAYIVLVPLVAFAATFTAAPLVWSAARRLRLPGAGERPGLALRVAMWFGIWIAAAVAMMLAHVFSWAAMLTIAIVLGLLESFLLQVRSQRRRRAERRARAPVTRAPPPAAPRAPASSARRRPPL